MENLSNPRVYEFRDLFPLLTKAKVKELSEPPAKLIYFDALEGVSKIMTYCRTPRYPVVSRFAEVQDSSIVVAVSCARKVDQGNAVLAFGVWFGDKSVYNTNGMLPANLPQTVQAAELYAVTGALEIVNKHIHRSPAHERLDQIIVITDSSFVKDTFSENIWEWEHKKYKSSRQSYVANIDGLKGVHKLIKDLEGDGVAVRFWKVGDKDNSDASGLAIAALMPLKTNIQVAEVAKTPEKKNGSA